VTRQTVIITNGEERAALAVVRSLGRSGYRCIVTESRRGSISAASRYCARSLRVPDALREPDKFADSIAALAAAERASVVIPIAEQSMLAILPIRDRLTPAVVPFPSLEIFSNICDKRLVLQEAEKIGIAVPAQLVVASREQISSSEAKGLRFPIVIKPARSVNGNGRDRAKLGVTYASSAAELFEKARSLPNAAFPLLLQERIEGPGTGIFMLLWDGAVRARFAHQRLCEKPPNGGVSVYCESITVEESLVALSQKLLERFGWSGVAMVEYKRDQRTGKPYLMEVNGRFWGSLQLAIDAGMDFPRFLVECALGSPPKSEARYRVGVRSRWWWGQVDHVVGRMRRRKSAPPIPPGTVSLPRAFGDMLLGPFRQRDYEEVMWWSDPRPFLNETLRWIGGR